MAQTVCITVSFRDRKTAGMTGRVCAFNPRERLVDGEEHAPRCQPRYAAPCVANVRNGM
jgi:hypothetical protein